MNFVSMALHYMYLREGAAHIPVTGQKLLTFKLIVM